ncbi:MAG: class I SAM-dependent methyltransferase [Candidatus Omnitrophica bacterium]|nr:class I SAM-dependent methyltransferase [Candidatus Omnitrophota bacterium]
MEDLKAFQCSSLAIREAVNYYRWLYNDFKDYIGDSILEIGGGIGNFSNLLSDRKRLVIVDIVEEVVQRLDNIFEDKANVSVFKADICDKGFVDSVIKNGFDTIICVNVLEHIADDIGALKNMRELLSTRGGHLLLLVPAHEILFSDLDRVVGHHRRYNKKPLRQKLEQAGFSINKLYYLNCLGAIGWFINYKILKYKEVVCQSTDRQIKIFDRFLVPLVSRMESILKPPFGISLIAVCDTKPYTK